mmetsp:Transcript_34239/g.79076  ORF Transcript_34239/g.79076 Transcript_34239/m.79076 type:complete len:86 (+) Transcript_34239:125-382(+)
MFAHASSVFLPLASKEAFNFRPTKGSSRGLHKKYTKPTKKNNNVTYTKAFVPHTYLLKNNSPSLKDTLILKEPIMWGETYLRYFK